MTTQTPTLSYSAERIRELLDAQGRKNKWLAEWTGNAEATIARYLNGTYPISDSFAEKTAQALGVPVHWLAEGWEATGA